MSAVFYRVFIPNTAKIDLFGFDYITTDKEFLNITIYYLLVLISFLFGNLIHYLFTSNKAVYLTKVKTSNKAVYLTKVKIWGLGIGVQFRSLNLLQAITQSGLFSFLASVFLLSISTFLLYVSYGGSGIFYRSEYIPSNLWIGFSLGAQIANIGLIVVLPQLYRHNKVISNIIFTILIFINISTGSRKVFIFIVLYALLLYMQSRKGFREKIGFLFLLMISFLLLLYLIQLRSLGEHGLIPYLLFFPESIRNFGYQAYFVLYYLFVFGFYVAAQTVGAHTATWSTFFIALNPLTGNLAGWYDIADRMRLNIYVPFSLYGEIFSLGSAATVAFFGIVGYIFGVFEKYVRLSYERGRYIFGHIVYLLCVLFTVYSYEYNLRSASRYIYYALLIILLQAILVKSLWKKQQSYS